MTTYGKCYDVGVDQDAGVGDDDVNAMYRHRQSAMRARFVASGDDDEDKLRLRP